MKAPKLSRPWVDQVVAGNCLANLEDHVLDKGNWAEQGSPELFVECFSKTRPKWGIVKTVQHHKVVAAATQTLVDFVFRL